MAKSDGYSADRVPVQGYQPPVDPAPPIKPHRPDLTALPPANAPFPRPTVRNPVKGAPKIPDGAPFFDAGGDTFFDKGAENAT